MAWIWGNSIPPPCSCPSTVPFLPLLLTLGVDLSDQPAEVASGNTRGISLMHLLSSASLQSVHLQVKIARKTAVPYASYLEKTLLERKSSSHLWVVTVRLPLLGCLSALARTQSFPVTFYRPNSLFLQRQTHNFFPFHPNCANVFTCHSNSLSDQSQYVLIEEETSLQTLPSGNKSKDVNSWSSKREKQSSWSPTETEENNSSLHSELATLVPQEVKFHLQNKSALLTLTDRF